MKHSEILKKYDIRAKKGLWQNFLINDSILEKIASYCDIKGRDIIEVWPWYWALTEHLLAWEPKSLTLIELDKDMIKILESRMASWDLDISKTDFKLNNIDVLKFSPAKKDYIVIANIPYYITSPILTHFFYDVENRPTDMMILMQKDVGQKIRKVAWNKNSVLSLSCDIACSKIDEILKVWPGNFVPAPKVESSVLHFALRREIDKELSSKLLKFIKWGFSEKRKKLLNNLERTSWIGREELMERFMTIWLHENVRAEELSLETWRKLLF